MKLTLPKPPLTVLTALAWLVLLTGSARAVNVSTGDLILGFKATGGTGADKNLEVNLGPASNYTGAVPVVVSGLSILDISGTYGSNWASRADLSWGIAGTTDASANPRIIWATRAETVAGTPSEPWPRPSAFTIGTPGNGILPMYGTTGGALGAGSATPNSGVASVIDASLPGSWSNREAFTVNVSFSYFNPSVMGGMPGVAGSGPSVLDGTSYAVLDLWDVRAGNGPSTFAGAFGINSSGQVVFSTNPAVFAAVPEPSAALTGLGALFALLLRRRRR